MEKEEALNNGEKIKQIKANTSKKWLRTDATGRGDRTGEKRTKTKASSLKWLVN